MSEKLSEDTDGTSLGWMSLENFQCNVVRKRALLSPPSSNKSSLNEEIKFTNQRGSTATANLTRTCQVRSADSPGRENHGMRDIAPEYSSERE